MGNETICYFGFVEEFYWLPEWLAGNIIIHYRELIGRMDAKEIKILWWLEYIDGEFVSKGFRVLKA